MPDAPSSMRGAELDATRTLPRLGERPGGTDPARFVRLEGMLEEATKNLIGFPDFVTFFLLSLRRLPGCVEPREAQALVDTAKGLPIEDRRVLAIAIEEMLASGVIHPHRPLGDELEHAETILKRYVDETLEGVDVTGADRALGSLLAKIDTIQVALDGTHTQLFLADHDGEPVDLSKVDLTPERVEALRVALGRVPEPLRKAARALICKQLGRYDWPPNESEVPAMAQLRAITGH